MEKIKKILIDNGFKNLETGKKKASFEFKK